jgi:multiple sugar transport system substrate-binding protein
MTHPVSLRAMAVAAAFFGGLAAAQAQENIFYSTQLRPIEEASKVRDVLLKGAPGKVTYVVDEPPAFAVRMKAETQAGKRTINVVGALHGELQPHVSADLQPVDDVVAKVADRGIPANLMELGKLGTGQQQYIPWMQATYVMVANKQALPYLPAGADVNALTYAQLQQWAKAIVDKTGQRRLGFPAGPTGLLPRFFQGYFYPSFTGGVVSTFKSADAEAGWNAMKELWAVSSPNSTNYNFMQEALMAGEVWIAWDHIARVKDALTTQPDQFVAFPAPAGPKGRGYMPVIAGLDALVSLLPVGLGAKGGEFNKVYNDTFQRIVLRNEPVKAVLESQAKVLETLMKDTGAPCWAPDKPSQGACPVQ